MSLIREKQKVQGVGINDADYPVTQHELMNGKRVQTWYCPHYNTWRHMLERCFSSAYRAKRPTYDGCSVCPEWWVFSAFRAWSIQQDWAGKALDKDLLIPGNRVYSPATCCYLSLAVNTFITDSKGPRSLPNGVAAHGKRFAASCGKVHLGMYSTVAAAHEAWRAYKYAAAHTLAASEPNATIAHALRTRYV
jgi:hypothetical protein